MGMGIKGHERNLVHALAGIQYLAIFVIAFCGSLAHATSGAEAGVGIQQPLTAVPGDVERGRALVGNRHVGLCLLCHTGPFEPKHAQGNWAPPLEGVGARLTAAQLRLRIVDSQRVVPGSVMPSYLRVDGLEQVGRAWRGQSIFTPQQVEDVVAYLVTLK